MPTREVTSDKDTICTFEVQDLSQCGRTNLSTADTIPKDPLCCYGVRQNIDYQALSSPFPPLSYHPLPPLCCYGVRQNTNKQALCNPLPPLSSHPPLTPPLCCYGVRQHEKNNQALSSPLLPLPPPPPPSPLCCCGVRQNTNNQALSSPLPPLSSYPPPPPPPPRLPLHPTTPLHHPFPMSILQQKQTMPGGILLVPSCDRKDHSIPVAGRCGMWRERLVYCNKRHCRVLNSLWG